MYNAFLRIYILNYFALVGTFFVFFLTKRHSGPYTAK